MEELQEFLHKANLNPGIAFEKAEEEIRKKQREYDNGARAIIVFRNNWQKLIFPVDILMML